MPKQRNITLAAGETLLVKTVGASSTTTKVTAKLKAPKPKAPALKVPELDLLAPTVPRWFLPKEDGKYVRNGVPVNSKIGRARDYPVKLKDLFAVIHSSEGAASGGLKSLMGWQSTQKDVWSGYHIGIGLDYDYPVLLMDPEKFRANQAREWNDYSFGIVLVLKSEQWPRLKPAQQAHFASLTVAALRATGHLSAARHPGNKQYIKDGNEVDAFPRLEIPISKKSGPHVAHDWLVSDRNKDGQITRADDWKSDPGEPIMQLIRLARSWAVRK